MGRELLEQAELYTIEWNSEVGVPMFTWTQFCSGEQFRESLHSWQQVIDERAAKRFLVNTKAVTAHDDADKQWLAETWIPGLIDIGVRAGAGVYADSAIAEMDMSNIESDLSSIDPSYEFRIFGSESDALEWLAEQ